MLQIRHLFAKRHFIILVASVVGVIIAVATFFIGFAVGRTKSIAPSSSPSSPSSPSTTIETCRGSLEGYPVSGSSVLGKYSQAAIAVENIDCSRIGRQILERNGTAVDAIIAAAICNGVMNAHSMGIGGGCVMVIYSKQRNKAYSIIGREQAPLAANSTMFIGREHMSTIGGLSIGTPGELRAYSKAYSEFGGGVSWKELFQPTIQLCREGIVITKIQATAINEVKADILKDPGMREIYVKNNQTNELYGEGDTIQQLKLARTLEIISEKGDDAFYTGELADVIVKEIQDQGGIITKEDLSNYQVDFREAIQVNLNESLTTFVAHPPTSGIILSFILNILRGYGFSPKDLESTTTTTLFYHRLIEAFKFAYAKRSELADPLKVNITDLIQNLTSIEYADHIRQRIDDSKTYGFQHYGGTWLDKMKTGTSHLSVIGSNGDAVAMTSTINLYFGSMVLGTRTGIIYNNEMDDFSTPNTTNFFGVPASPANFIAPGKRPSSSMAPLIMFDQNNQRVLQVLGGSGGTKITTAVAQVAMLNLWFRKDIKQAIDTPRLHSQLLPEEVLAERGFNQTILEELRKLGHNIQCGMYGGSIVQGIEWRKQENQLWACSDVRKSGAPNGI
ncbi:unnamed protein product [Rotaria sp. Silwood1]|nr:unnamed protein product [Rotaria sp. Silwood1]